MHELSIAAGIVEIVEQHVAVERRPDVRTVTVAVGDYSGVVPEALTFSFEVVAADAGIEEARLEIRRVPVVLRCPGCGHEVEQEPPLPACPGCGGKRLEMVSGSELQVLEVELEDRAEETS